nr:penicillin-binding transpeptidase domain-containing protein [Qaidamihabitans albus]
MGARRWILGSAALAVVAIVAAAAVVLWGGPSPGTEPRRQEVRGPGAVAADYLAAFARGDLAAAAALTDDPAAARSALADAPAGLEADRVEAALAPLPEIAPDAERVDGTATLTWTLGKGRSWTYDTAVGLRRDERGWAVHWSPALIHPELQTGQSLLLRTRAGSPAVLDRQGRALLTWQADGPVAAADAGAPILLPAMGRVAAEQADDDWSVTLADEAGNELKTLHGTPPAEAEPLIATLDGPAQRAAQSAVDGVGAPALLVALQPSSGDILAVAQNAAAGAAPDALIGLYAPGSTFKIATATAVLGQGGVGPGTVLPCPGTARIGTRTIPNDDEFDLGSVSLHTAFAHSCNTTFARLAADLPADALARAADRLGLNADFGIPGLTTEAGGVAPAPSPVQRLEDGIGQGKVQASPFGVALMAATVANGTAVTPRLWRDLDTAVNVGYEPPSQAVLDQLRPMMREVVTSGTATALNGLGDVHGKTGTAQLPDPTQAHGWFAGFRGDVAFAVLVQGSGTSAPAVDATAAFLSGLPG